jgi:hypothetical protein
LKTVDVQVLSRTGSTVALKSKDLATGDQVVQKGVGFLRMIAAQLGAPEEEEEGDHSDHEEHGKEEEKDEHGHGKKEHAHDEKEAGHHD